MKIRHYAMVISLLFFSIAMSSNAEAQQIAETGAPPSSTTAKPDGVDGKSMPDFLADKDSGQISASSLVGVANSAITNIQTSQDIIIALKPSDGKSKSGFGISITPARTAFTPMPLKDYYNGNALTRMLGSLTISYASKDVEVGDLSITKRALSLDTSLYWNAKDDPIIIGTDDLRDCKAADSAWGDMTSAADKGDRPAFDLATKAYGSALDTCLANSKKRVQWNAARASVAFGSGQISGDGIDSRSMGSAFIISAMIPLGAKGSMQPLYRRTWNEVDLTSLKTAIRSGNSNLWAARFTYGLQEDNRIQVLAEVSNLKKTNLSQSENLFRDAVGLDLNLAKGIWLQLRYGNSRRAGTDSFQKSGLLSLNFSPSCALSAKCGK